MYHKLAPKTQAPVRRALLGAVEAATRKEDRALVVGLDELSSLDTQAMNGLITALRRMRDAGGTVKLHVTRPDLLRTLTDTGLDRVFKVVASPDEPRPKPARKRKRRAGIKAVRKVAGGMAAIFVALAVLGVK